jgi:hypothetical protein
MHLARAWAGGKARKGRARAPERERESRGRRQRGSRPRLLQAMCVCGRDSVCKDSPAPRGRRPPPPWAASGRQRSWSGGSSGSLTGRARGGSEREERARVDELSLSLSPRSLVFSPGSLPSRGAFLRPRAAPSAPALRFRGPDAPATSRAEPLSTPCFLNGSLGARKRGGERKVGGRRKGGGGTKHETWGRFRTLVETLGESVSLVLLLWQKRRGEEGGGGARTRAAAAASAVAAAAAGVPQSGPSRRPQKWCAVHG